MITRLPEQRLHELLPCIDRKTKASEESCFVAPVRVSGRKQAADNLFRFDDSLFQVRQFH